MKINTTKQISQDILTAIQCDKCKKTIDYYKDSYEFQEMISLDWVAGYCSIFGDGNEVSIDLCEHCIKELLGPYIRINE